MDRFEWLKRGGRALGAAVLLCTLPIGAALAEGAAELTIFKNGATNAPDVLYMGTPTGWAEAVPEKESLNLGSIKAEITQIDVPGDGRKVTWTGGIGQVYFQSKSTRNLEEYLDADSALVFDAVVHQAPEDSVVMRVDCKFPCIGLIEASGLLKELPVGKKTTVKIPLSCFAKTGTRFTAVNTPFLIYSTKRMSMSFANVRWVKGAAKDSDARSNCS